MLNHIWTLFRYRHLPGILLSASLYVSKRGAY